MGHNPGRPKRASAPKAPAPFAWLFVPVCAECGESILALSSFASPRWARERFLANHGPQCLANTGRPRRPRLERVDTYKLGSKRVQRVHAAELGDALVPRDIA